MENLYEKCSECDGKGFNKSSITSHWVTCKKCRGCGELDWVEKIVGINESMPNNYLFKKFEMLYKNEKVDMDELEKRMVKNGN